MARIRAVVLQTSPKLSNDDTKVTSSENDMQLKISLYAQNSLMNIYSRGPNIEPCGTTKFNNRSINIQYIKFNIQYLLFTNN